MRELKKYSKTFLSSPDKIFLCLALLFGTLSALLVPQLSVSDEQMHFLRAYSMSSLSFKTEGCAYPSEIAAAANEAPLREYHAHYSSIVSDGTGKQIDVRGSSCGSAAAYNPLLHAPQAIGIEIAKLIHPSIGFMVLMGRLASVLFYTFLIYFTVRRIKIGKWPIVVIALFPLMIHFAGSLSGDAINNAVVLSFLGFVVSLLFQRKPLSKGDFIFLLVLSFLLINTKTPNLILLGSLLFLSPQLFSSFAIKKSSQLTKWLVIGGTAVVAALLLVIWQKIAVHPNSSAPLDNPLTHNPLLFFRILYNTYISPFVGYTDVFFEGITDHFSSFQYSLPNFMVTLSWILLVIVLLIPSREASPKHRGTLAILSMACLALLCMAISYGLYSAWAILPSRLGPQASYADGVQGRYFTAFLPLLIPLFLYLQRFLSVKVRSEATTGLIVLSVSAAILLFYIHQTKAFLVMSTP